MLALDHGLGQLELLPRSTICICNAFGLYYIDLRIDLDEVLYPG